jgi:hypothetical protein
MAVQSDSAAGPVSVDMAKRRVFLTFRGFLSVADAERLHDAYREAIARVGRGYTAVSIFEGFVPGTEDVQAVISKMIKMANDKGCLAAARVAEGSVFGPLQLGRLQREVKAGYPVKDFKSLTEANAYLDGLAREARS